MLNYYNMKKLFFAIAVVSTAFVVSCNTAASGDPKTVFLAFMEAMSKKNYDGAKKLATRESGLFFMGIQMASTMGKGQKELEQFDKDKVVVGDAVIKGDSATVAVSYKDGGNKFDFPMLKQDGEWKVDLNISSLMNMGLNKMKDLNADDLNKIDEGMDAVKNMSQDSLNMMKKKMLENMEKFKSMNQDSFKMMQEQMLKQMEQYKNVNADSLTKLLQKKAGRPDTEN